MRDRRLVGRRCGLGSGSVDDIEVVRVRLAVCVGVLRSVQNLLLALQLLLEHYLGLLLVVALKSLRVAS